VFLISDRTHRDPPFFWNESIIRIWTFDQREPEILGQTNFQNNWNFDIDSQGRWLAYSKDRELYVRSLGASGIGPKKFVGKHDTKIESIGFQPGGDQIASSDSNEIRLWPLIAGTVQTFSTGGPGVWFDPKGLVLFGRHNTGLVQWDLTKANADPLLFRSEGSSTIIFDKKEQWFAIGAAGTLTFYLSKRIHPYIFHVKGIPNFRFTSDSKSIVSDSNGIYLWNIPGDKFFQTRKFWDPGEWSVEGIDLNPLGTHVLAATLGVGVHLISIASAKDLPLHTTSQLKFFFSVSFSPDGNSAAAAGTYGIEIWDLKSGKSRTLEQSKEIHFTRLQYDTDGTLISGDNAGKLYQWDLNSNTMKILKKGTGRWVTGIAMSKGGRYLAVATSAAKTIIELPTSSSELILYDRKSEKSLPITSHGKRVFSVAFDATGSNLITGDVDGVVRVGPISGDAPHQLLGHSGTVKDIVVDPRGRWFASMEFGDTIRLWPIPHGKPVNSLSYNEFLNYLREQTNVRVVVDKDSPSGYRIQYQPFSGWKSLQWRE
jgi:WD40 repeat protein